MPVEIAPGIRTGSKCFYGRDDYAYHVNKFMKGGRVSLRCAHYAAKQCSGRASCTRLGRDFRQTQPHNHASEPATKDSRRLRAAVLARCREDGATALKVIYDQERRRLRISPEAAAWVPYQRLRSSMLRARYSLLPNIPHTISELREVINDPLYEHLTRTLDGRDKVYAGTFGSTADGTRCMIFASKRQLKYLRKAKKVFSDATFDSMPAGMEARQLWNISTTRRGRILPVARIVMISKSEECYNVALDALQSLVPRFRPKSVNCDFETAQMNAWKRKHPYCKRRGCLFHFTKNASKTARKLGLTVDIREDEEVARLHRMVCALPLLPTNRIESGLIRIGTRAVRTGRNALLERYLKKIDKNWLKPSVLQVLSVWKAADRTSNVCESDNSTFARSVGAPHPNIWRFLAGTVEMEDLFVQDLASLRAGRRVSRQRRASTLRNDERILGFQEDLEEGNISEVVFLRRASRRLQGIINQFMGIRNI